MASQPGKQAIAVHVLSNISRSKGDQAMKFWETFFLKNHAQVCGGETIPRAFSKKLKLSISLEQ